MSAVAAGAQKVPAAAKRDSIARVTIVPPDSTPLALFRSLGEVSGAPLSRGPYIRDMVLVEFNPGTPLAERQAAIDAVAGVVVGGSLNGDGEDGAYYVRVPGGTSASLLTAVRVLQLLPQVGLATLWSLSDPDDAAYRRPIDSAGFND